MATIREHFETSFPYAFKVEMQFTLVGLSEELHLRARAHLDFDAHAHYASIFVPQLLDSTFVAVVGKLIAQNDLFKELRGVSDITLPRSHRGTAGTMMKVENDPPFVRMEFTPVDGYTVKVEELAFTKRLYVYAENEPTEAARFQLGIAARAAGVTLSLRGPSYAKALDQMQQPMAFISHDSRDKDAIARKIAIGLQEVTCTVWYDEFSLVVGDSLRESIERGLKTCRYCVVVLTPNFLSKGGWPKREYDIAFTREVIRDERILLPVWHEVTRDDVYAYSPILADRVGIQWSLGQDEVCRRLFRAIDRAPDEQ